MFPLQLFVLNSTLFKSKKIFLSLFFFVNFLNLLNFEFYSRICYFHNFVFVFTFSLFNFIDTFKFSLLSRFLIWGMNYCGQVT